MLHQLLLQQSQLLLLHALVITDLLQLPGGQSVVAVVLLLLLLLWDIVIFLGGAVAIAAAARAATVACISNMLPAGRVAVGIRVGVVVVAEGAFNISVGTGRAALAPLLFGNVYESHDECKQKQQHRTAKVLIQCCCNKCCLLPVAGADFIFGCRLLRPTQSEGYG